MTKTGALIFWPMAGIAKRDTSLLFVLADGLADSPTRPRYA